MWKFPVLLLVVTAAKCTTRNEPRLLGTPSNFKAWKETDTSVELSWDLTPPPSFSLRDVEFTVHLMAKGERTRKFNTSYSSTLSVRGLSPATEYLAMLEASFPDGSGSSASTTFETDFPAPIITSATGRVLRHFTEYYLTYEVAKRDPSLRHFEIQVCDKYCFAYTRNSTQLSARVAIAHQSEFEIAIVAVYEVDGSGSTTRGSKKLLGRAGSGLPGGPMDFFSKQKGNMIMLEYNPSHHPEGPTSYYDIFAIDFSRANHTNELNDTSSAEEVSPALLRLGTVNDDESDSAFLKGSKFSEFGQSKPPKHLLATVVRKVVGAARFRLVFQKPTLDEFSEVDVFPAHRRLYLGSGIADALNFTPYRPIQVNIRSCLAYKDSRIDACGDFAEFEIQANVAEPSEIACLQKSNLGGKLRYSWSKPKEPHGPIDGYKVVVEERNGTNVTYSHAVLTPKELSFVIDEYSNKKTYNIGIAAFNVDLQNSSLIHEGKWTYLCGSEQSRQRYVTPTEKFLIAFIIALLVYVLLMLATGNQP